MKSLLPLQYLLVEMNYKSLLCLSLLHEHLVYYHHPVSKLYIQLLYVYIPIYRITPIKSSLQGT